MKRLITISLVLLSFIIVSSCNRGDDKKEYVKKVELNSETIAVGIYKATGYEQNYVNFIAEALKIDGGIVYVTLSDADILKTKLENIDVILFPEIENGNSIDQLDDELAEIFRKFISKKGAIAMSNGSCLLLKDQENQTLNLVGVGLNKVVDEDVLWSRIGLSLTDEGKRIFPELESYNTLFIDQRSKYSLEADTMSGVKVLGHRADSENNEALFITSKYNSGKIFITNTHPETTPGMRWMLPRIVRWVYNKDFISYSKKVFRPEFYSNELIMNVERSEKIKELEQQLEHGKKDEIIAAINELQNIDPYQVAEKIRPLLIQKNNDIKLRAAKFLVDVEYTSAIDDLKLAIRSERSKKVKEQLNLYLYELESMLGQN